MFPYVVFWNWSPNRFVSDLNHKKKKKISANKTCILEKILHNAEIVFLIDLAKNTTDEPSYDTQQ